MNRAEVRHITLDDLKLCILTKHCDPSILQEEILVEIADRLNYIEEKLNNDSR